MREFISFTLGGISFGMVYAAIGLSLVLIWRATRILNYAQGGMAMFTTFIALSVIHGNRLVLGGLRRRACVPALSSARSSNGWSSGRWRTSRRSTP